MLIRLVSSIIHILTSCLDIQDFELPRLTYYWTLFRPVRYSLDLLAAFYQLEDPLGSFDRIQNRRSIRAELGDPTIQMLDQPVHHLCSSCQSSGRQSLLALLDHAHLEEVYIGRCCSR